MPTQLARRPGLLAGFLLLVLGACSGSPATVKAPDAAVPRASPDTGPTAREPLPGPDLILPDVVALPYVRAGQGGSSTRVVLENAGNAPATGPAGGPLRFVLTGDSSLTLSDAPATVAPGQKTSLGIAFAGAAKERLATADLRVEVGGEMLETTVHAVAGDEGLGEAGFAPVFTRAGALCGEGATVDMPAAPYPHPDAHFTDSSVRVFVPEGYRDLSRQDLVVHFHGHSTTLEETLEYHRYQEHVWASGANVLLVVPQGPVDTASSNFGKLMDEGGLARLVSQVLVLLYREGRIRHPVVGEVMLTAHSGGFRAVAANLTMFQPFTFSLVGLYDAVYADTATFAAFPGPEGWLRSSHTPWGGTTKENQSLAKRVRARGIVVEDALGQRQLGTSSAAVAFADASHSDATRVDGVYGEVIRFAARHSRRGPRIELRTAIALEGQARVTWVAPPDEDATGIRVETSEDADSWRTVDVAETRSGEATFSLSGGAFVRVSGIVPYTDTPLTSDVYRVDDDARVLVVDGFDRILDGAWAGLAHDFAARVGQAAGPVHTVSHRAFLEDGFDPKAYPVSIWILGDESTLDRSLHPDERNAIKAYVEAGGRVIAAGSEVAHDLDEEDSRFLDSVFGASYVRDDARSREVRGSGPLAHLGTIALGMAEATDDAFRPDTLGTEPEAEVLLRYGTGTVAAVGLRHRSALVGFSLELVTDDVELAALVGALVDWVQ